MRRGKMAHHEKDDSGVHGVTGVVVGSEDIDAEDGVAGVDSNGLLSPAVMYHPIEEYNNHLGVLDDFMEATTTGNATVSANATNHRVDLDSGLSTTGNGIWDSKPTWTLGTKPIILNVLVQNIVNGDSGWCLSYIGLRNTWNEYHANSIAFFHALDGTWDIVVKDASNTHLQSIDAIVNGDLLTIIATSSRVQFWKNGTLLHSYTTYIPTVALSCGAMVRNVGYTLSVSRKVSVDMIDIIVNS